MNGLKVRATVVLVALALFAVVARMPTPRVLLLIVAALVTIAILAAVWYLMFEKVEPAVKYRLADSDERDLVDFDKQIAERDKARKKGG